ncbi:hypothetical protein A3D08_03795 [Candidatus Roizmanbacteria bacterium RIFCSPHIGHO2_02_FULL_43_11]|uniref:Bacterial sugar transferase domain-containing protein n=1 Tax=Candidatus Roizmanbacteria bacterium RIFCSPHIGHO2_02_FULL_43_11 TaxID=1802043 RepID=A0A1F7HE89_9BACT|nr:MAG: hypothetical protein A3D08_03795 [Candidatus Roizmanbacteria bacterium RIFCSPHIGHO2_02_FULL_43_11]
MSDRAYVYYIKPIVDYVSSFMLLILFSPICVLTIVAIKLDSQGPVFADVPDRVGRDRKPFHLYKFRSMIQNAHNLLRTDDKFEQLYEEYKKNSYKIAGDPRITRVGKFIRKYSLDELPQFINVLRGEMSLVGPRAYYLDEFTAQQEKYPDTKKLINKVISVKPGITGLWQVSGRSEINFDKRVEMDAQYVDNISLLNDITIILKTPWAMISGKGAM